MSKLIGTAPNQVPTNADLGTIAYQDYDTVFRKIRGGYNYIINGDFTVSQRGDFTGGYTNAAGTWIYTVDRWQNRPYGSDSQTITHKIDQEIVPNLLYANSLKIEQNSSTNNCPFFHIIQPIEGQSWMSYKTFTVSYWYKTNATSVQPRYCDGNNCFVVDVDLIADGEWHYVSWKMSINYQVPTSGATFQFHPAFVKKNGQSILGGEWIEFALVQMELGDTASEFQHRLYVEELALCQRYYEVIQQNQQFGGDGYNTINTAVSNGEYIFGSWIFKVTKRTLPSIGVGNSAKFRAFGNGSITNAVPTEYYSPGREAARIRFTTSTFAAGQCVIFEFDGANSTNGYLYAEAEL